MKNATVLLNELLQNAIHISIKTEWYTKIPAIPEALYPTQIEFLPTRLSKKHNI